MLRHLLCCCCGSHWRCDCCNDARPHDAVGCMTKPNQTANRKLPCRSCVKRRIVHRRFGADNAAQWHTWLRAPQRFGHLAQRQQNARQKRSAGTWHTDNERQEFNSLPAVPFRTALHLATRSGTPSAATVPHPCRCTACQTVRCEKAGPAIS